MIQSVSVITITAALFLAIILTLAVKPAVSGKITGCMLVISAIGGFLIYGYGYSIVEINPLLAVIRATLAVCGMFVGKNDLGNISSVPVMKNVWMSIVFWLLHLFALYTSASAAITTIGAEAMKKIRLALARRGRLVLIYGVNEYSLSFGEECNRRKDHSVVFVSRAADAGAAAAIGKMGAALRTDRTALQPTAHFLKRMGVQRGRRALSVYCMGSERENYAYARALKEALREAQVDPKQTSLVMFGQESSLAGKLQTYGEEYGFGNVAVFQSHDQAARLLVRKCPPWEAISFDETGRAREDLEILIIGFGLCGQSVLKEMIRNGQFTGSRFRATVIDPGCRDSAGYLQFRCPGIFRNYNIEMIPADGRSEETFRLLDRRKDRLKYVIVCVGDAKVNQEITASVVHYFSEEGKDVPVAQCTLEGVTLYRPGAVGAENYRLVSLETLDFDRVDHMAMALNHRYSVDPDSSLWEDWRKCDYFSRMSSRAFADFMPAFLKMLGRAPEEAAKEEKLQMTSDQAEILGSTEHLRWCAFHDTMGFIPMTRSEWEERARQYRQEKEEKGSSRIRIGKDMDRRRHACMIPWEELDELSAREAAVTGRDPRYRQLDIRNVEEIPVLLRMCR